MLNISEKIAKMRENNDQSVNKSRYSLPEKPKNIIVRPSVRATEYGYIKNNEENDLFEDAKGVSNKVVKAH